MEDQLSLPSNQALDHRYQRPQVLGQALSADG